MMVRAPLTEHHLLRTYSFMRFSPRSTVRQMTAPSAVIIALPHSWPPCGAADCSASSDRRPHSAALILPPTLSSSTASCSSWHPATASVPSGVRSIQRSPTNSVCCSWRTARVPRRTTTALLHLLLLFRSLLEPAALHRRCLMSTLRRYWRCRARCCGRRSMSFVA